ncbi:MAG: glycosyltransferase family 9 protein [Endomicrobiales bacterium]|nr:glycosyltransferase family 9 protein [Endomicrobiales bacterium]
MDKIIFFHMNQLGDLLFSLPVLYAAKKELRDVKLSSLVRPELVLLLEATGLVDEVIVKPRENIFLKYRILKLLKEKKFNKAVLFSESPESLLLSYFAGIQKRCGFSSLVSSFILTEKVKRAGVPSLLNNMNLGKSLGLIEIPKDYTGLVKVPGYESEKADYWLKKENIDANKLVIVAPGSSSRRKHKQWMQKNWISLIMWILNKGFSPVLIGSQSEIDELRTISNSFTPSMKIFSKPDGIMPLAALIKKAKIFVGIDSGAMHLAASLSIPVVALFGPTDPNQIGPQPLSKHKVIKKNDMQDIQVEEVCSEIGSVLY